MSRRRYRKKSNSDGLFELLLELTGFVWQIGAVATVALLFLSYMAYDWAETWIATAEKSPALLPLATTFGWVAYLLPVMFAVFAVLFSVKTYETYRAEHF